MTRAERYYDLINVQHDLLGGVALGPFVLLILAALGIGAFIPLATILMLTMA